MLARSPIKTRTMAAIEREVAKLPPFPSFGPLPDMNGGGYRDRPCGNPRERMGALQHNPTCICGWMMGEHDTKGGAV